MISLSPKPKTGNLRDFTDYVHRYSICESKKDGHSMSANIADPAQAVGDNVSVAMTDGPGVGTPDDDDGDGDDDPDRRRSLIKKFPSTFPPALLGFADLSHYVQFGRSRIYQLIGAGKFPSPVKVGKSSRWVRAEVDQWLFSQVESRKANLNAG